MEDPETIADAILERERHDDAELDNDDSRRKLRELLIEAATQARGDDGSTLVCIPQLTKDGRPFVTFTWGDQEASVDPDAGRQIGLQVLEAAEMAEQEALIFAWLRRDPEAQKGGDQGVIAIIAALRRFRAEMFAAADAAEPPSVEPEADPWQPERA